MRLEGLRHLTMIAGDAPATVEFHAGVLGLRPVKKTVNFDAPEAHHLSFGRSLRCAHRDGLRLELVVADDGNPPLRAAQPEVPREHAITGTEERHVHRAYDQASSHGERFEIATLSPGFAIDEDPEHLGGELRLPKQHAHLRERLDRTLAPLSNPRRTRETA